MMHILEELEDMTCIELIFMGQKSKDLKINPSKYKKILLFFLKSFLLNFWD
jgi:hypothetical protein